MGDESSTAREGFRAVIGIVQSALDWCKDNGTRFDNDVLQELVDRAIAAHVRDVETAAEAHEAAERLRGLDASALHSPKAWAKVANVGWNPDNVPATLGRIKASMARLLDGAGQPPSGTGAPGDLPPVTTELREALSRMVWNEIMAHVSGVYNNVLDGDWLDAWHEEVGNLCDQIDSVDRNLVGELRESEEEYLELQAQLERLETEVRCEWTRLPIGADGVPIGSGDWFEDETGHVGEAVGLLLGSDGWHVIERDGGTHRADAVRRVDRDAQTLDDVILDFGRAYAESDGSTKDVASLIVQYCERIDRMEDVEWQ